MEAKARLEIYLLVHKAGLITVKYQMPPVGFFKAERRHI